MLSTLLLVLLICAHTSHTSILSGSACNRPHPQLTLLPPHTVSCDKKGGASRLSGADWQDDGRPVTSSKEQGQ